jgi:hypothetical protein
MKERVQPDKKVIKNCALGERGDAHAIHVQLHRAWAEMELEANRKTRYKVLQNWWI